LTVPAGVNEKELRKALRTRFGLHFAGGQDRLEGKIIRMSHMGFVDAIDTLGAIAGLEQALHSLGHRFELGAGLRAAQQVFAERG
jgi:aspartate aminotransferase-like enzyme